MYNGLLSKLRNQAFWFLDKLNGGKVREYYLNLKSINEMDADSAEFEEKKQQALQKLLEHAFQTTEFYRVKCNKSSINDFPVINKNIIRSRQKDFISNSYKDKKLKVMKTSGSTGTPFASYQNQEKKNRVIAELIYYNEKLGYYVGKELIFLRSLSTKSSFLQRILRFMQNQTLINVSELNYNEIEKLLGEIERKSYNKPVLMSYASTLDAFRDYFEKNGNKYNFNISGLISGSEMLYDETREAMENVFNCKCVSRYSNQENGVLGQDEIENNSFIINEAHYYVEIFKLDEDTPAENGEIGRIIITDLYNYAMPMIRYDTGDVGAIKYTIVNGIKKKAIYNFGGRKIDMIYTVDGNILSPHKISVTFWAFSSIKQFQFIQLGPKNYQVILNVESDFNAEFKIREKLHNLLGATAIIDFIFVDDIPALSSGKRKYIMNKWEK